MVFSFTSCTKAEAAWQEQFDTGLRYMSELEYESAIQAFNEAIKIDPKQAPAYISLAEVYVRLEDYTSAHSTLDKAIAEIGETDELIIAKDKTSQQEQDSSSKNDFDFSALENTIVRTEKEDYTEYGYDENDRLIKQTDYYSDGSLNCWRIYEYDENNNVVKSTCYEYDGSIRHWYENEYDNSGYCIKTTFYDSYGFIYKWYINEFDENGNCVKTVWYDYDESVYQWIVYEYDNNGNCIKESTYDANDLPFLTRVVDENGYIVEYIGYGTDGSIQYWYTVEYPENDGPVQTWHSPFSDVNVWEEADKDAFLYNRTEILPLS